jgi:hypothetical protein
MRVELVSQRLSVADSGAKAIRQQKCERVRKTLLLYGTRRNISITCDPGPSEGSCFSYRFPLYSSGWEISTRRF